MSEGIRFDRFGFVNKKWQSRSMPTPTAFITPSVLVWARSTAGLNTAELAAQLGHADASRIEAWENGSSQPTMAQLRNLANKLKRPTATFFLPEPPPSNQRRTVDFRSMQGRVPNEISSSLQLELRLAQLKRLDALSLADDLEEQPAEFRFSIAQGESAELVAVRLRALLEVPLPSDPVWRDKYSALNAWKGAVERLGVLVMQVSGVDVGEMRGCAIAEFPLPIILLNSADSPAARSFSLLHEMTHLGLGQSSLCDFSENSSSGQYRTDLEVYCNYVAGAVLVPRDQLVALFEVQEQLRLPEKFRWQESALAAISRRFGTSVEVIARRLTICGIADPGFYSDWKERQERVSPSSSSEVGYVEFFRKVISHNGRVFTKLVVDAYRKEVITGSELSRMLGTKLTHLPKIEEEIYNARRVV